MIKRIFSLIGVVLAVIVGAILLFPLLSLLFKFLMFGLLLLLLMALLSPFEALSWWAGWSKPQKEHADVESNREESTDIRRVEANHYLVYLSGIGAISGDFLDKPEIDLLDELEERFPNLAIVRDVFPYAMNNRGLTSQRFLSALWQRVKQYRIKGKESLAANLMNIRNMFQVAVSADLRYGPIYNYGSAEVIRDGLLRQNYRIGSAIPVTILGYSGGGQIAIGAASYLQPMIAAPLRVISLGGVMADDPGLDHIKHLYHLFGSKDPVQKIGSIAYAGRWPFLPYSPWNRAKAAGKITMIPIGPIGHTGPKGYFGEKSYLQNGQSHLECSVEAIEDVLQETNREIEH